MEHHRNAGNIDHEHLLPTADRTYNLISMDIGTWIHYAATTSGLRTYTLSPGLVHHFGAASWGNGPNVLRVRSPHIAKLEEELAGYPELDALYREYSSTREGMAAKP